MLCYVTHCEQEVLNILTGFLTDNRDTLFYFFKQKKKVRLILIKWVKISVQFIFWSGFRGESDIRVIV